MLTAHQVSFSFFCHSSREIGSASNIRSLCFKLKRVLDRKLSLNEIINFQKRNVIIPLNLT